MKESMGQPRKIQIANILKKRGFNWVQAISEARDRKGGEEPLNLMSQVEEAKRYVSKIYSTLTKKLYSNE